MVRRTRWTWLPLLLCAGLILGCEGRSTGYDPGGGRDVRDATGPVTDSAGEVLAWIADGTPSRQACTNALGSGLTATHGRMDGYLVSIVPPGHHGCNGDSSHVHLQVLMLGSIYDVAVNVGGSSDVLYATLDAALVDGTWSEGWHTSAPLDYVAMDVHAGDFTLTPRDDLANAVEAELAYANHVSVFAIGYGPDGAHLVHRNDGGNDGALVVNPLSPTARYLLFHFPDQSF